MLMQGMDQILDVDEENLTATVQGGAISALIDDHLAPLGLGLPIIGDHRDITVGGFASVGGISPASHRFGMFIDNVLALEFVDWDGEIKRCSREENSDDFYSLLAGLGRHGVITEVTLRLIRIDKYRTIWENHQSHYRSMDDFIAGTKPIIEEPGDVMMERGVWVDFKFPGGKHLGIGQFSEYRETSQTAVHKARNTGSYGVLHGIGRVAGNLPEKLDMALKYVGMGGVMLSPKYASIKNIEFFTDKVLDSTVGDPTRMLIVLGPLDRYEELFRRLLGAARRLPRLARLLHVPVGLRQEHPLRLPRPRRPGPLLRAHVLHGRAPRQDDPRAARRDRRAVRRHRHREQRATSTCTRARPRTRRSGRRSIRTRATPSAGARRATARAARVPATRSRRPRREARDPALHARGRHRRARSRRTTSRPRTGSGLSMLRFNRDPENAGARLGA